MVAFGGGLAAVLLVGGGAWWGLSHIGGPRSVPLLEPDPRPFKVRPDDPGGLLRARIRSQYTGAPVFLSEGDAQ